MTIPLIVAHRAGNSYEAIENAVRLGADIIELDIRMTKDGVLVASHSPEIKINGYEMYIGEKTYNFLYQMIHSEQNQLLKLYDILILARENNLKLLIDIKNGPIEFYPEINIKIARMICNCNMQENVRLVSFDQNLIYELKKQHSFPIKAGVLVDKMENVGDIIERIGADLVETQNTFLTQEVVSEAHALGAEVVSWSTDDLNEIKRLINLSIDLITTESPQLARKILSTTANLEESKNYGRR
jgi:glycerophosphoryl diester phosphodiesterase